VLTDVGRVADLNQVVQLRPLPHMSCFQGCPVDAAVRTNLHIVPNLNTTDLGDLGMAIWAGCETEPFATNHCSWVQPDSVTEPAASHHH
jgi:hypothetical protein